MTRIVKFINGSKAYLMISKKESLNISKVSCQDQNYTMANLSEKEVDFVKKKFLLSTFSNLKYFVNKNKSNFTSECYKLLSKRYGSVYTENKCPIDHDYEDISQTLCEKHISDVNNSTTTNQILYTSNNTMIIIIAVVIAAVVLILVTLCYLKRRNNSSSNEVSIILVDILLCFLFCLNL